MNRWDIMFRNDKRKFYFDSKVYKMYDLLTKLCTYYDAQGSFHNIVNWLDFSKPTDSTKLKKIDKVIVRIS